jgi:hypothetical protein
MSNPNKAKGDQWERDTVAVFQANGLHHVERAYGAGRHDDRGDLAGLPRWIVDCKNHATLKLSEWIDSVHAKKRRPGDYGAVIIKRRLRGAEEGYVVLRLDDFTRLVAEAENAS